MGLGFNFGPRVPYKGFMIQSITAPPNSSHAKVWKDDGMELVVVHRATNAARARKWVDAYLNNPVTSELFKAQKNG